MSDEERDRFSSLNTLYREKFGFPFILAARNASKFTVLSAIEGRLTLSKQVEFAGALFQASKIAWMRLLAAFDLKGRKGFLTCIVLDTANGCPAKGMRVVLSRISPPEKAGLVKELFINSDGSLHHGGGPALKDDEFIVGVYECTFYRSNTKVSGMPFLDVIPLRFGIDDPEEHYHVALLLSPWRGS
jgi:2-oxo-4-hydroxy-4-carboxy-5-ureidoimidazoline decarboxylase